MAERSPLLPRPVVTTIAVVVLGGWLLTVVAAVRNPASAGPLVTVSGLLAMVIGASVGVGEGIRRRLAAIAREEPPTPKDEADT
jgi:hypothetical protein